MLSKTYSKNPTWLLITFKLNDNGHVFELLQVGLSIILVNITFYYLVFGLLCLFVSSSSTCVSQFGYNFLLYSQNNTQLVSLSCATQMNLYLILYRTDQLIMSWDHQEIILLGFHPSSTNKRSPTEEQQIFVYCRSPIYTTRDDQALSITNIVG